MKNNFRFVNTCMTCSHCIDISEQDDDVYYYCNLDNTFKEEYYFRPYKLFEEMQAWLGDHSVREDNVCDDFTKRKNV